MKIEVGKEYITASGNIVKVIEKDCNEVYPYDSDVKKSYTEKGQYFYYKTDKDDLICEIVPSIYALYKSGIIDLKELIKQHIEYYTK